MLTSPLSPLPISDPRAPLGYPGIRPGVRPPGLDFRFPDISRRPDLDFRFPDPPYLGRADDFLFRDRIRPPYNRPGLLPPSLFPALDKGVEIDTLKMVHTLADALGDGSDDIGRGDGQLTRSEIQQFGQLVQTLSGLGQQNPFFQQLNQSVSTLSDLLKTKNQPVGEFYLPVERTIDHEDIESADRNGDGRVSSRESRGLPEFGIAPPRILPFPGLGPTSGLDDQPRPLLLDHAGGLFP
jgi:hypothetical protein